MWCEVGVQLYSFACGHPVVPAPFIEEDYSFSIESSWHLHQKAIDCKYENWFLNSFQWHDLHVSPHANYCSLSLNWQWQSCSSGLLFRACFGYLRFLTFPHELWGQCMTSCSRVEFWWGLHWTTDHFREYRHLLTDIKSSHPWAWMSFYLFSSSLISFTNVW